MSEWKLQKYWNVPAFLKVKEKVPSWPSEPLSHVSPELVWLISSLLIQVTLVPTAISTRGRVKLRISTVMDGPAGAAVG